MPEDAVKICTRGHWTRVLIEQDGKDASHLSIVARAFQVGPAAQVRMAGIAGVATHPEYRRRGLAARVLSHAMDHIRQQGYCCAGLYTGTDIVAHRLYRRFGFVDVLVHHYPVKLLDPAALVGRSLGRALRHAAEHDPSSRDWRCVLAVEVPSDPTIHLQIESSEVRALSRRARHCDLTLTTTRAALLQLCFGAVNLQFAEASGLLGWRGGDQHWRTLQAVLSSTRSIVHEGEM
jgi:hypothetical protein